MKRIILIEDDPSIGKSLTKYLEAEGFQMDLFPTLEEGKKAPFSEADLLILDWMLPDGQGIDLLRQLKDGHPQLPIIMLTAKVEVIDKVLGLEMGADDYLTKPFDPRELLARIRARLRAPLSSDPTHEFESLSHGDIQVNLQTREIAYKTTEVVLNRMEFDLLIFFMRNPNIVFSRQELLDKVWGMENFPTTRTVDTHILNLRNKISSDFIETIRGVGYRLK